MSCKMYLVPEDVIQTWRAEQRDKTIDNPLLARRQDSDDTINTLLNKKNISDYDKEILLAQEMGKFQTIRDMQHQNNVPIMPLPTSPPHQTQLEDQLMSSIPKTYKAKAESLLRYLKTDKDVSWDNLGRLILKGQVVPQTHMIDLIHDALRKRKKVKRAKGWSKLSKHLGQRNIPQELIGNQEWLQEQSKEDYDMPSTSALHTPVKSAYKGSPEPSPVKKGLFTPLSRIKERVLEKFTTPSQDSPKRMPRASKTEGVVKIKNWISHKT